MIKAIKLKKSWAKHGQGRLLALILLGLISGIVLAAWVIALFQ